MKVELINFVGPSSGASHRVVGYATFSLPDAGVILLDLKVTRNGDSGLVFIELPTAPVVCRGVGMRNERGRWITRNVVQFINKTDDAAFKAAAKAALFARHPHVFDHISPDMPILAIVKTEGARA